MAEQKENGISWCQFSFNAWWGCTKVSQGCKNCYAETLSDRFNNTVWGPTAARKPMSENYWKNLDKWQRQAERGSTTEETRPRVFCNSMSDLFEGPETCQDEGAYEVVAAGRERLFKAIGQTPNLTYLLLTKRAENLFRFAPDAWKEAWPKNVMAGVSVENQAAADERVPLLLKVPARRFLSVEPLLGPVSLFAYDEEECALRGPGVIVSGRMTHSTPHEAAEGYDDSQPGIDWVIVGGESGPGARPMAPNWVRALRDECQAACVPFHFKQWGQHDARCISVGKHAAGRLLDGEIWNEFPETGA